MRVVNIVIFVDMWLDIILVNYFVLVILVFLSITNLFMLYVFVDPKNY